MAWLSRVNKFLSKENYLKVIEVYEQEIAKNPDHLTNYYYLGLAYLLNQQKEQAQEIWISILTQAVLLGVETSTEDLIKILGQEGQRQEKRKQYHAAEQIYWQIIQLNSSLIDYSLQIISLRVKQKQFEPQLLEEIGIVEQIKPLSSSDFDVKKLQNILLEILSYPALETIAFLTASLEKIPNSRSFIHQVVEIATTMAYDQYHFHYGADLLEVCLKFQPNDLNILNELLSIYKLLKNSNKVSETTQLLYDVVSQSEYNILLKLYFYSRIISSFTSYGQWAKVKNLTPIYYDLLSQLLTTDNLTVEPFIQTRLLSVSMLLPYLKDQIPENRYYTNQLAKLFQQVTQNKGKMTKGFRAKKDKITKPSLPQKIKIGYMGYTLKKHSVGWLSRWLFHYHDPENFEIYLYLINQPEDELTEKWFRPNAKKTENFPRDPQKIVQQIQKDKIDILVDLDSLTNNLTYQVLALKPAPIQVSWLGFDATGLPSVDYFLVDSYVVPETAQDYYQESLWRLPQTYIAVESFEVGKQTRFRQTLGIEEDAIIYLTVQNELKLNPRILNLQLQIIANVPNSYLLIKPPKDPQYIQALCEQLAQEKGLDLERIHFLERDVDEMTHRANLQIADLVLDTYPYNGATTTLEVLWLGIPVITWVGQQFSARNSYTFLMNLGITEGIAWTEEEYVEWGIKMGQDLQLRQSVVDKLQQSRTHSPLWDARSFTQQVENAYRQMILAAHQQPVKN